jgi:hypothetical protein
MQLNLETKSVLTNDNVGSPYKVSLLVLHPGTMKTTVSSKKVKEEDLCKVPVPGLCAENQRKEQKERILEDSRQHNSHMQIRKEFHLKIAIMFRKD